MKKPRKQRKYDPHLFVNHPIENPYIRPNPVYYAGDRVRFEGEIYTVTAGTDLHTQLEGLPHAIANWKLKLYRRKKKNPSVETQFAPVSASERSLGISPDPFAGDTPIGSPEETHPTAKEGKNFKARLPTAAELSHFWKPRSLGTSQAQWSWLNSKAFIKKLLPLSQKIAS
jgi:hypothetical protein